MHLKLFFFIKFFSYYKAWSLAFFEKKQKNIIQIMIPSRDCFQTPNLMNFGLQVLKS